MDETDDEDTMNKTEIINAVEYMTKQTRRALVFNPVLAQEYYEKVQHLTSTYHMVKNFERQLLFDLEVD
jgi:hypothetical protein